MCTIQSPVWVSRGLQHEVKHRPSLQGNGYLGEKRGQLRRLVQDKGITQKMKHWNLVPREPGFKSQLRFLFLSRLGSHFDSLSLTAEQGNDTARSGHEPRTSWQS